MTDKLEELEKRLYEPEEGFPERKEAFRNILGEKTPPTVEPEPMRAKTPPHPNSRIFRLIRRVLIWLGAGLALVALGFGFYAAIFRGPAFARRDVIVSIEIPSQVRGGESVELGVVIENKTPFTLSDGELTLLFPEGTIVAGERRLKEVRPIGTVPAGELRRFSAALRLLGTKDALKSFSAKFSYRPGSISSRFENAAEASTTIISTPFAFSLDLPQQVFPGSTAEYTLVYKNTAGITFSDAVLLIEYPRDFIFGEAAPELRRHTTPDAEHPSGELRWTLGELRDGERGKIIFSGAFRDTTLDQPMKASLGVMVDETFVPYAEVEGVTRIAKPFFTFNPTVNAKTEYAATIGERLAYHARWQSVGPVGLEGVTVKARLAGALFDIASLRLPSGVFDSRTNEITWSSRELSELAVVTPQENGSIGFDIALKKDFEVRNAQDREFSVGVQWTIETTSVPAGLRLKKITQAVESLTKINSRLELTAFGFYTEPSRLIVNTGPIPPRVNETTTYTLHWLVKNIANAVENLEVSAVLGPGVEFLEKMALVSGEAPLPRFNARSGEVTWSIPRVEPGLGILEPAVEVVFQVALTPSVLAREDRPLLLAESRLTGTDTFTRARLEARAPRVTTATIEGGGVVQ